MNTDIDAALAEAVMAVTGLTLSADTSFFNAGITSAHVVTIHERVQRALGREFPVTAFFRHPTRRALTGFLATEPTRLTQPVGPVRPTTWTASDRRAVRALIRDRQR